MIKRTNPLFVGTHERHKGVNYDPVVLGGAGV